MTRMPGPGQPPLPAEIDAILNQAIAALQAGRRAECLRLLRGLGSAGADHPTVLQVMAVALGPEASADAHALLERAVRIAPGDAQAHFNLGCTVQGHGDLARAVRLYETALRLDPLHTGALNNLSDLYRRRGRWEEGWALMHRYRQLGAPVDGLEIRLAKLAMDTRRFDDAAVWFEAAERRAPHDPVVQFEHAMLTLAREDFARGFKQYDKRLEVHGLANLGIYPYAMPPWQGENLVGQSLLLHREQGLGDMIMFSQAVPEIVDAGVNVHMAIHPSLARLMKQSFPRVRVWSSRTAVAVREQPPQPWLQVAGPIARQLPVCSLGSICRTRGFPKPHAYMKADARDVVLWKERLDALAPRAARRIGLCLGSRQGGWSEDARSMAFRKSIPPSYLRALSGVGDASWIGLHDRETAHLLADTQDLDVVDTSDWLTDLADTAALIQNLDLVVTIDSAVAHLSGALGKETWLLLWWNPDWRWGIDRVDSYLYPHMRVFRQDNPGDWTAVIERVIASL